MGTSVIDGTLTASEIGRTWKRFTRFNSLTFERDDGSTETLRKQVVGSEVAQWLQPGASSRFYRFAAFDVKGIHGVRLHDGTEIHACPDPNKRIFFVAIPALVALIAVMVMTRDAVPMLAVIGLVIATIGFIASQAAKRQSLRQLEGAHGRPLDAGRRTSPNL